MAAVQEAPESLKERARRVLLDNSEPGAGPGPAPVTEASRYTELIDLRLRAIRLVRDMEPKRACFSERVRSLSQNLVEVPGDSIHYRSVLEKLREAHQEWLGLEEMLWAANYMIRSTQWLVDLLADPSGADRP
jgi:hypothetical protein